jgi:hypothetical protein
MPQEKQPPCRGDPQAERPDGTEDLALVGLLPSVRVVTIRGERPADELEAGDIVAVMAQGGYAPVQRVMETVVDLSRHPEAAPVLFAAWALEDHAPLRPTAVPPRSLVGLGGRLVPAEALVNGRSIRRAPARGVMRYVQLELGEHDLVIADGLRVASLRRGEAPCWPLLGPCAAREAMRRAAAERIPRLEAAGFLPR